MKIESIFRKGAFAMASILGMTSMLAFAQAPGSRRPAPPKPAAGTLEPIPQESKPKPFVAPPRETFRLANGVQVSLAPYGEIPLVSVAVSVQAGLIHEAPGEETAAAVLAQMMKEGAGSRNAQQLAEEAAALGGSLAVSSGTDSTSASISVLSEFSARAVQLLADVIVRPTLPESEFERVRAAMLRNIAVSRSRPDYPAEEALAKAMFPAKHPYARTLASEEDVRKVTLDAVRKFHAAQFGGARTHVYVVGKFDRAKVKRMIEEAFGGWKKGPDVVRNIPQMQASRQVLFVERPNSEQSVLRFAIPVPVNPTQPDYIPLMVTNSLLGGSFISRITVNIREEKGYTYSPRSTVRDNYRSAFWAHYSEVANKFTLPAVQEISKEIARLRAEAPPADELERIKAEMCGTFVIRNASNGGVLSQLMFVDQQGLTDDYIRSYVAKVQAVTRADVQRLAETYLNPGKMTYVVVGDREKSKDTVEFLEKLPKQ